MLREWCVRERGCGVLAVQLVGTVVVGVDTLVEAVPAREVTVPVVRLSVVRGARPLARAFAPPVLRCCHEIPVPHQEGERGARVGHLVSEVLDKLSSSCCFVVAGGEIRHDYVQRAVRST
eukprot:28442-Pyramimonas_sp.AAC.2